MKKLFFLLSMALTLMTSCGDWNEYEETIVEPKYVDNITYANGNVLSLEYDSDMRVKSVNYVDATDTSKSRYYTITYNLNMTNNNVTFDIVCGEDKYVMKFNEYGALDEFVRNNYSEEVLSSFYYNNYTSIGAFHLNLVGVIDNINKGEVKRIDWSNGTPVNQINQMDKKIEGVNYTYSTSIQYTFDNFYSNVLANINLFVLLTPEFLEYSNIPTELAAAVSVFGTRSSYIPTQTVVVKGRSVAGENYVKLSEDEREFSYETSTEGYIEKIYTVEGKEKSLLYTINYVGDKKDEEKK